MLEKALKIPFKIILKLLKLHPITLLWAIKKILKLHSYTYHLSGELAILHQGGIHPKHDILKYKEWFVDQIHQDDFIFDIGCHMGLLAEKLSVKAKFVYGIEIDKILVLKAQETVKKSNVEFICADATSYDFSQLSVNCVTLSNVLEHIEYRVDFLQKIIKNIPWIELDDRRIYIRVPLIEREWIAVYKKQLKLDYRLDPTHYTEYTVQEFCQEMKEAGIEILSYDVKFGEIFAVCKASNLG
ncbi:class I SAM-dependent methyltransferase [bacterium]|nr:class I SAM-dependent methyltransferase [bacterium]